MSGGLLLMPDTIPGIPTGGTLGGKDGAVHANCGW
jgi:hypothetical protein